jgi:hypothetical protein
VYKVATRLTGDGHASLLAALLFALIPAHAEAVLSIAATNYPLGAAFQLGAFCLIMQRAETRRDGGPLALVLYVGALLCHESALMFPAVVASYVVLLAPIGAPRDGGSIFDRAATLRQSAILYVGPFVAAVLVYLTFRTIVLHMSMMTPDVGTGHISNTVLLLTLPRVMLTYVALLAIPWMAGDSDRVSFVKSAASPDFYLAIAALIVLAACTYVVLRNHPRRQLYLFCMLWTALGIAPMLNLRGLWPEGEIANRYFYLPRSAGA